MRDCGGVFFVGLDLAWGVSRPTGVAVLDADGGLKYVGAALHDGEIVDAVSPYVQGECPVAIDAPLIVANATGQRPAERALNAHFGGFVLINTRDLFLLDRKVAAVEVVCRRTATAG
ncbi:MAG: DUF429 domain-containing protein [Mycobacterium sp.]|nr:MAG: DUF429 domain-containing protein [Mycobacterium sp.]